MQQHHATPESTRAYGIVMACLYFLYAFVLLVASVTLLLVYFVRQKAALGTALRTLLSNEIFIPLNNVLLLVASICTYYLL